MTDEMGSSSIGFAGRGDTEQRFFLVADNSPLMLWVTDCSGHCTYINRRWYEFTGQAADSALGGGWIAAIHPAEQEPWKRAFRQANASRTALHAEHRVRHREDDFRWVSIDAAPQFNTSSQFIGYVGSMVDISDKKRAEAALKASQAQFAEIITYCPIGTFLVDGQMRLRHINPKAATVFAKVEQLIGSDFEELMHVMWPHKTADEVIQRFRHTLITGESFYTQRFVDVREDRAGGKEYYDWELHRIPLLDGTQGVICYFTDISSHVLAQQELQRSEQRFRFMAESLPQKIFTARASGEVDYYNPEWSHYTGLSFEEIRDWGWVKFIHPNDKEEVLRRWNQSIKTGEPFEQELRFRRHDGIYEWHLTVARAMRDPDGKITMWLGSSAVIQTQKRAEEQLEHIVTTRTAQLRDTIEELESFSYSVSHDMRAPLRAMQSFALILEEDYSDKLDAMGKQHLHRIVTAAERMDRLIQGVLNYNRVVRAELALQPVDLAKVVADTLDLYPFLQASRPSIRVEQPLPPVIANEAALGQCISNLLANALKFVSSGQAAEIVISAKIDPLTQIVRVSFQDNGSGIEPDAQSRIFDLFQRVSHTCEGTDVGLTIVKKIVERMNGRVGVESHLGHGSCFWFELRSAPPAP